MTETRNWIRAANVTKQVVPMDRIKSMLKEQRALDSFLAQSDSDLFASYIAKATELFHSLLQDSTWSPSNTPSTAFESMQPTLANHQSARLRYACHLMGVEPETLQDSIELSNERFMRSGLFPRFYAYQAITEVTERDHALQLIRDFIDTWYAQEAEQQPEDSTLSPYWDQLEAPSEVTNGIAAKPQEGKLVFRVDGCILHEVMQPLDDPILADLACCYGDRANFEALNPNFVFTRVHTLMTGPYCDTCMHDRRLVDSIDHPTQEYFEKL